jgi:predicted anti-sigma-YlaC factor YlaD
MHTILNQNLERYLEGRLPVDLQSSLDSHLEQCSSCQEVLNEAMESSRLLKVFALTEADPAPEPMPGFALKVLQGIETGHQPARQSASFWSTIRQGFPGLPMIRQLAMAAVMLLVLAGGYVFTLQTSEASTTAGLLFDMPVEHDAPALITGSEATGAFGHSCLRCWQSSESAVTPESVSANEHANREQTMTALLSE